MDTTFPVLVALGGILLGFGCLVGVLFGSDRRVYPAHDVFMHRAKLLRMVCVHVEIYPSVGYVLRRARVPGRVLYACYASIIVSVL